MTADESVTRWIQELKAGDPTAAAKIWQRYCYGLVAIARQKLSNAPRRAKDEEDVVQSAFESFFRRAKQGQFPELHDREGLWHLLITIAERKAFNQRRYENRSKRGGGKVSGESAFRRRPSPDDAGQIGQVAAPVPTPELAAEITEEFQRLLNLLDEDLQQIALWKFEGYTNQEIAAKIDRSVPTVERRLGLIRRKWSSES